MAKSRLTIGINAKLNAAFQWTNFNFNSMAVFNGVPVAANEDGLYSLFDADDDDAALAYIAAGGMLVVLPDTLNDRHTRLYPVLCYKPPREEHKNG